MIYRKGLRGFLGLLLLGFVLAGCGDDDEALGLAGENDDNGQNSDNGGDNDDSPEITDENACELACERVYASSSDGGCQQVFRDDTNSPMSEDECVIACEEEDSMMAGAACVADPDEVDCLAQPDEMVSACLADDFHVPACEHLDAWPHESVTFEQEVVEIVNDVRAEGVVCTGTGAQMPSAGPVHMDPHLQCASRLHSINMHDQNNLAHELDGEDPTDRGNAAGYPGSVAENIAMGYTTPQEVVDGWLSSDTGHCENLMEGSHTDIGIGYYRGTGSHRHWWTQKFG